MGNLQKGLTSDNHVYFKTNMMLSRSKKNFNFPFKKIEFLFFPHAEFLFFCCQKQSIREERSTKKQMYMKQKRNPSKFQSNFTKIEGKNVNLGFNPHVKS